MNTVILTTSDKLPMTCDITFCTLVVGDINYITCSVGLLKSIYKKFPIHNISVLTNLETVNKLERVYSHYKFSKNVTLYVFPKISFKPNWELDTGSLTWGNTYNKLNMYKLPFHKVVYIDCDYVIRSNFKKTLPKIIHRLLHSNDKVLVMDRYSLDEINFYTNRNDGELYEGAGGCMILDVSDDLSEEILKFGYERKIDWEGEEFLMYNYYKKHHEVYCTEFLLTKDFYEMNGNCNDDNRNFENNFKYGLVYSYLAISCLFRRFIINNLFLK